jgi:hypothetical protein
MEVQHQILYSQTIEKHKVAFGIIGEDLNNFPG